MKVNYHVNLGPETDASHLSSYLSLSDADQLRVFTSIPRNSVSKFIGRPPLVLFPFTGATEVSHNMVGFTMVH